MKHTILIISLFLVQVLKAQTYVASASDPADNGTNATFSLFPTMPAGIQDGDLLIIVAQSRTTASDIKMVDFASDGQSWQDATIAIQETNITGRLYWCRYNANTTSFTPQIEFLAGTCTGVSTHAFRPDVATNSWKIDQAPTVTSFGVPGGPPYNVTAAGQTSAADDVVALAVFMTADDNSWFLDVGSAWTALANTQYRNLAGADQSMSVLYKLLDTSGSATGDAIQRQTANGPDAGATAVILFREYTPVHTGFPIGNF